MAMMKDMKELRDKSPEQLAVLLRENKAQAQESYIGVTVKQEKTLKTYRDARRMIARITTVVNEKKSQ